MGYGDLARGTGDLEYLRVLGRGDLARVSLRGECALAWDLGLPL